jgi:hypothetical protein
VLIRWIETLHNITNVNILSCVPRFLLKLFDIVRTHINVKTLNESELGKKALNQLEQFLQDFEQPSSRNLELDRDIIVKLNKFLKTYPVEGGVVDMEKGHYMALTWLRDFIQHFEVDYNIWQEDCKDMLETASADLSEDSKRQKEDQRHFMNEMFQKQFPDVIEIILIYTQKKHFKDVVNQINTLMLQLVLNIMKDKNDLSEVLNKLRNEFKMKVSDTID